MKKVFPLVKISSLTFYVFFFSCSDSSEVNSVSQNNNTNNTIIQGDTSEKKSQIEEIANVTKEGVALIKEGIDDKRRADSVRNANESRIWVYQIGDAYDDAELAANAYDKFKNTEPDLFIFKRKRKEYYLLKGNGVSTKEELKESLNDLGKRFSSQVSYLDLSMVCRYSPINTKPFKYKNDNGDKKEAECKTCE